MRAVFAILASLIGISCAQAAPDDSRCPIDHIDKDAYIELQESDVTSQATGTLVTCKYRHQQKEEGEEEKPKTYAGTIGFRAYCPNNKLLRFPGYTFDNPTPGQLVIGLYAAPGPNTNEYAEVLVWRDGAPDALQVTVLANCAA